MAVSNALHTIHHSSATQLLPSTCASNLPMQPVKASIFFLCSQLVFPRVLNEELNLLFSKHWYLSYTSLVSIVNTSLQPGMYLVLHLYQTFFQDLEPIVSSLPQDCLAAWSANCPVDTILSSTIWIVTLSKSQRLLWTFCSPSLRQLTSCACKD